MKSDKSGSVLVIDDDKDVLYTARLILRDWFEKVDTADRPALIPEILKARKYDVILLDMNFTRGSTSGKEGLELLDKILKTDPDACVLTTTAYGEINLAVQAIKRGAVDFIIKPWNREQLIAAVTKDFPFDHSSRRAKTSTPIQSDQSHPDLISRSPVMAAVRETIKAVAPTDANVLILGENGTGKELAAWALHRESLRSLKPFIHVDLGSIPEPLFESELFGHSRGAFTDAKEERTGRFQEASSGTIFLDEIGNLSMSLQAKLLTAIQKRAVIKIGSNNSIPVDVRIISATNMPLYEMADSFDFRQDLLYRINTVEITLPPLRDRKEDIDPIADYYLGYFSKHYNKPDISLSVEARLKLKEYHWPGNIRELAHSIERAIILCKGELLSPEDFSFRRRSTCGKQEEEPAVKVEDYERLAISRSMSKHSGNLSKVAEEIGIARSTLYRKIARFGIEN